MSKTLLVLGGRSDIARATAHEFAANGFDIILAARNSSSLSPEINDLDVRFGVNSWVVDFDAAETATHKAFYDSLPAKPDVVLYAIGSLGDQKEAQTDAEKADEIISSNYTGAVSILSIVANDLEERNTGSIIGISSVAGERGRQSNYIYGSAKSGFSTFLDGLRHRMAATNVHVMTVKPGFVATKMTDGMDLPAPLTATPEQVGKAIYKAFLKKRPKLFYFGIWRQIMFVIRSVPEFIFVKSKL